MALLAIIAILPAIGSPQEAQIAYKYDCTQLSYAAPGCKSYNELIASNDSDIISSLKVSGDAFVCFIPDDDEFFVATFTQPAETDYVPTTARPSRLEAPGFFSYSKFKNGVQDSDNTLFGNWVKFKNLAVPQTFSAKDEADQTHANISDSEVAYDASFQNLNNTKTTYALQIRRSTLRFNETYTFPQVATPTKTAVKSSDRIEANGHCVEFK